MSKSGIITAQARGEESGLQLLRSCFSRFISNIYFMFASMGERVWSGSPAVVRLDSHKALPSTLKIRSAI